MWVGGCAKVQWPSYEDVGAGESAGMMKTEKKARRLLLKKLGREPTQAEVAKKVAALAKKAAARAAAGAMANAAHAAQAPEPGGHEGIADGQQQAGDYEDVRTGRQERGGGGGGGGGGGYEPVGAGTEQGANYAVVGAPRQQVGHYDNDFDAAPAPESSYDLGAPQDPTVYDLGAAPTEAHHAELKDAEYASDSSI